MEITFEEIHRNGAMLLPFTITTDTRAITAIFLKS
jgi:hypothetical protein